MAMMLELDPEEFGDVGGVSPEDQMIIDQLMRQEMLTKEQAALKLQQAKAKALMGKKRDIPQGAMIGDRYVPASLGEKLGSLGLDWSQRYAAHKKSEGLIETMAANERELAELNAQETMRDITRERAKDQRAHVLKEARKKQAAAKAAETDMEVYFDADGKRYEYHRNKYDSKILTDSEGNQVSTDGLVSSKEEEARLKADASKSKLTKQKVEWREGANLLRGTSEALRKYSPEFSNDTGIPNFGSMVNRWVEMGLPATEVAKRSAMWWKEFSARYELLARHDLFGTALTGNEDYRWMQANLHSNLQSPEAIRVVERMQARLREETRRLATNAIKYDKWDPQEVYDNLQGGALSDKALQRITGVSGSLSAIEKEMHRRGLVP